MERRNSQKHMLVDISELTQTYLPMSRKKARKFVKRYLDPIWIGNRMYVDRALLEALLDGINGNHFPLDSKVETKQE